MLHLSAVSVCWVWFGFPVRIDLFLAYCGIGALSVGAIPSVLLVAERLVTPALVVAGALTVSAYGTWTVYVAPPVAPTPVDPTPFGWYLLGWVIVVAVTLAAGGIEYGFRQFRRGDEAESSRIRD